MYAKQTQTEVSSYEGEGTGSEDEDTEERVEPSYREVLGKARETKEQDSQVRTNEKGCGTVLSPGSHGLTITLHISSLWSGLQCL